MCGSSHHHLYPTLIVLSSVRFILSQQVHDLKRRTEPKASSNTAPSAPDGPLPPRSTEPDGVNLADGSSPNFRDGNEDDMWGQGG